jgi:hypothetical protein
VDSRPVRPVGITGSTTEEASTARKYRRTSIQEQDEFALPTVLPKTEAENEISTQPATRGRGQPRKNLVHQSTLAEIQQRTKKVTLSVPNSPAFKEALRTPEVMLDLPLNRTRLAMQFSLMILLTGRWRISQRKGQPLKPMQRHKQALSHPRSSHLTYQSVVPRITIRAVVRFEMFMRKFRTSYTVELR